MFYVGTDLVVVGSVARRRQGWGEAGPGRPSLATPELKAEIIDRLSKGDFLTAICQEDHMPSSMSVYRWRDDDPQFALDFARARELGALAWVEEGVEVARTTEIGSVTTFKPDGVEIRREDMLGHRRLKADTFFKAAAVICPSKFGQKALAAGEGGNTTIINGNVTQVKLEMSPQEAAEAYMDTLKDITP